MTDEAIGKYDLVINGYDWGPGADKIILHTNTTISSKKLISADFEVTVETMVMNWGVFPPAPVQSRGKRTVTSAYPCDANGVQAPESNLIALELSVHPEDPFSNPFFYASDMMNHWQKVYDVVIKNKKLNLNINELNKRICPLADQFTMGTHTTDDITLSYASWEPKMHKPGTPLIIWLHGMGEGGTDPNIVLLGNKVVNLITPTVQRNFRETGAYVLAPQAPTFWMQVEKDNKGINAWVSPTSKKTDSIYTQALFNLIDDFVAKNPDIDENRIYIGGCSNGGYMTMNMLLHYPDYFAAAYPICQAYPDAKIDDRKLEILSEQHIWFTQSKDDKTVNPAEYTVPTFARLQAVNSPDVHFSFFDSVTDQTGDYFDKKGKPYKFNGHFSWVYVLNNECEEAGYSIFQWLSRQSK